MSAPDSICILRLSAIGDVSNAVSVVQAIQRHYAGVPITWVIGKIEAQLLEGLPGIEFVVFDKHAGWRGYLALRRALAGRRFDVLLHMQLALRANLAGLCISARRRIGYDRARSKELHSLFINERIASARGMHVLDGFRQFGEHLGIPLVEPEWRIPVSLGDRQWAMANLPSGTGRHLLVCPAASAAERNWLPERYAALADHATASGFAVTLCGGPAAMEGELARQICRHAATPLNNLVGRTTLKQLQALLQQATLVVAPDTGPAHMANAVGTPVIGLYGHSNPGRTGPYCWRHYVVDTYHDTLLQQSGKTAEQVAWGKRLKHPQLMQNISVERVVAMFDRVVAERAL